MESRPDFGRYMEKEEAESHGMYHAAAYGFFSFLRAYCFYPPINLLL
jgi:hypothetical protein